jgi:hypothetical protein
VAIRAFAGDDIRVAKYYDFDKDFLIELELCLPKTPSALKLRRVTSIREILVVSR